MKKNIIVLVLLFQLGSVFAQVKKLNYGIEFNSTTCTYDAYLNIVEGSATNYRERIQLNSQLTLVVPTGSQVYVEQSFAPLVDNKDRNGTKVAKWSISNFVENPASLSGSDIYAVVPTSLPTAAYNDLIEGTRVKLFSFSVYPILNCGEGIRLFENNEDPASHEKGMMGGDYTNSFTLGGIESSYEANDAVSGPLAPIVSNINVSPKTQEVRYEVLAGNSCGSELTYTWKSPSGQVIGNNKSFPGGSRAGDYILEVKDELGCQTNVTINPFVESIDQTIAVSNGNNTNTKVSSSTTSVSDVQQFIDEVSVYPNPAKEFVNITVNTAAFFNDVNVTILTMNGQVAQSGNITFKANGGITQKRVPLNLNAGIYTLQFTSNNEVVGTKNVIVID